MNTPLSTDAITAYRLAMQEDRTVPLGTMMSIWNMTDPGRKHGIEDLPRGMVQRGDQVACIVHHDPLRLSEDEIIEEAFRLSSLHRRPERDGWHNMSNLSRVASRIGARRAFQDANGRSTFSQAMQQHLMFETRKKGDVLQIRPRVGGPVPVLEPVTTILTRPGDADGTQLPDQPDFGSAFRALLSLDTTLAAAGTIVQFKRGGDDVQDIVTACFDGRFRQWMTTPDDSLRRTHPSDPVRHSYPHGNLVDGHIGYVTKSRSGRIFANVGRPIDSEGDDDAFVSEIEHQEFDHERNALRALHARTDLDRVFTGTHGYRPTMGLWLSELKDSDQ